MEDHPWSGERQFKPANLDRPAAHTVNFGMSSLLHCFFSLAFPERVVYTRVQR